MPAAICLFIVRGGHIGSIGKAPRCTNGSPSTLALYWPQLQYDYLGLSVNILTGSL